jgi:hypothetical protein
MLIATLAGRGQEHPRGHVERQRAEPPLGAQPGEQRGHQLEAQRVIDRAALDAIEHAGRVAQHDPRVRRVGRRREERLDRGEQPGPGVAGARRDRRRHLRGQRLLELEVHRGQHRRLAGEVVVERALGQAGARGDVVERGLRVAAGRELVARRAEERAPSVLDVQRPARDGHTASMLHTGGMLKAAAARYRREDP